MLPKTFRKTYQEGLDRFQERWTDQNADQQLFELSGHPSCDLQSDFIGKTDVPICSDARASRLGQGGCATFAIERYPPSGNVSTQFLSSTRSSLSWIKKPGQWSLAVAIGMPCDPPRGSMVQCEGGTSEAHWYWICSR